MEKYRSTADPSTGIHPFLPLPERSSVLSWVAKPLALLRLPLFLLFFFAYVIFAATLHLFSSVPVIAYPLYRVIDYILLTPILVSLSVWWPSVPTVDRPRVRTHPSLLTTPPTRGDVVFTNHSSMLDLFFLTRAYSPTFVVPVSPDDPLSSDDSSDVVVPISLFTALSRVTCAPPEDTLDKRKKITLRELSCRRSAPIVVLAEGCTSNSRGVLTFAVNTPLRNPVDSPARIFALGLSYSHLRREVNTVSTPLLHFFHLLTLPFANVRARVTAVPADTSDIHRIVATLAGVPPLTIGCTSGKKFLTHWRQTIST